MAVWDIANIIMLLAGLWVLLTALPLPRVLRLLLLLSTLTSLPWIVNLEQGQSSGLAALSQHAERGALVAEALGAPVAVVELIRRHEDDGTVDERQRLLRLADDCC